MDPHPAQRISGDNIDEQGVDAEEDNLEAVGAPSSSLLAVQDECFVRKQKI
jgi:hypothetical protein